MNRAPIILRLLVIALICGAGVSLTNQLTLGPIEANRAEYATQQLRQVLGDIDTQLVMITPVVFEFGQPGLAKGHIFELTTHQGYNGDIKLWLAVTLDGKVKGVRVISHMETPGLADELEIAVSDWILSFNGKSLQSAQWRVKKDGGDFDQFTGATITPRAVVDIIRQGLADYSTNRKIWSQSGSEEP